MFAIVSRHLRCAGYLACMGLVLWVLLGSAQAAVELDQVMRGFPTADRLEATDTEPSAQAVFSGDTLLGYVFETEAIAPVPAYSGKPINILVGIDTSGRIVEARVLSHAEPILLVGIPEQRLQEFVEKHIGAHVNDRVVIGGKSRPDEGTLGLDLISGATVTVIVANETIMRAARRVAVANGLVEAVQAQPPATVRSDVFAEKSWQELTGDGSIRRLQLTHGQVNTAFENVAPEAASSAPPDETFIDLYYAYLNAPTVGRNLLGDSEYEWLMGRLEDGEHAIAVMANGDYSFKGSGYVRGGIFDRVHVVQNGRIVTFRDLDHARINDLYAAGAPRFAEMDIFIIRKAANFDPGSPWQLELLVRRATGPLTSEFVSFAGDYTIPEAYVERPEPVEPEAMWVRVWRDKVFQIAVLGVGLAALTLILMFQDPLVRRKRLLGIVRHAYLAYTLFFIGWYALAQLSVVNVLTFVQAVITGFSWDTFLVDPMIFILWSFVAITLLLWGRGVFCGWLCPYGALQELINAVALKLKVKQWAFPYAVHERLWPIKYMILLVLFAISLHSMGQAERAAEVEPFKTAINFKFQRDWGYALYAGVWLVITVVNRKFYCRYVCPLGAALAIGGRLRLFDWLKRHRGSCGEPCQICANECEVQCIHPSGHIIHHECHYCLDCQVNYWDDHKCPPMIKRRQRFEKAARVSSGREAFDALKASAMKKGTPPQ